MIQDKLAHDPASGTQTAVHNISGCKSVTVANAKANESKHKPCFRAHEPLGDTPERAALDTALRRPWHVAATMLSAFWLTALTTLPQLSRSDVPSCVQEPAKAQA